MVNGKAKLKPKLPASKEHSFPWNHFPRVESCVVQFVMAQKAYCSKTGSSVKMPPQRAACSSDKIWPNTLHANQSINQSKHNRKTSGKGNRSLKDSSVWRNYCQFFRNRMYFLKLVAWHVLASSGTWIPLFSGPCLPVEPWPLRLPWLVRPPSLGHLDSAHQAVI